MQTYDIQTGTGAIQAFDAADHLPLVTLTLAPDREAILSVVRERDTKIQDIMIHIPGVSSEWTYCEDHGPVEVYGPLEILGHFIDTGLDPVTFNLVSWSNAKGEPVAVLLEVAQ